MLPEDLQRILDATDYADFEIDVLKVDLSKGRFKMQFLISDTEGSARSVSIAMTVLGYKDFFIDKEGNSSYIHWERESPLLWRFNDTQCELYIAGQTRQIEKVVFELLQSHHSLFKLYLPFDLDFLTVLKNGHGLLKRGPGKLLTAFAHILHQNGIPTSIISEVSPGSKAQNLSILFIGDSYVIGEKFEFEVLN